MRFSPWSAPRGPRRGLKAERGPGHRDPCGADGRLRGNAREGGQAGQAPPLLNNAGGPLRGGRRLTGLEIMVTGPETSPDTFFLWPDRDS